MYAKSGYEQNAEAKQEAIERATSDYLEHSISIANMIKRTSIGAPAKSKRAGKPLVNVRRTKLVCRMPFVIFPRYWLIVVCPTQLDRENSGKRGPRFLLAMRSIGTSDHMGG